MLDSRLRAGRRAPRGWGGRRPGHLGRDRARDAADGDADAARASIDELQAASAVGQGTLFRAYEERLARAGRARRAGAADLVRPLGADALPERPRRPCAACWSGACVPVVNENDTTATDEITFGDNDFLSAQVAILLGARLLVLLTDTAGLHTGRSAARSGGAADRARSTTSPSSTPTRSATAPRLRLGRDAQQGRGGRDGERRPGSRS